MTALSQPRIAEVPCERTGVLKQPNAGGRRLRVGVIGSGAFAAQGHIQILQTNVQAEVRAICGRNHDRTNAIAAQFGIQTVYTDYRELCARPDIDAVTIVTPNAFHADQAIYAFRCGKHVLCEKPLARTLSEARAMLEAASTSGKIHQVYFLYRCLYGVRELRRRVLAERHRRAIPIESAIRWLERPEPRLEGNVAGKAGCLRGRRIVQSRQSPL